MIIVVAKKKKKDTKVKSKSKTKNQQRKKKTQVNKENVWDRVKLIFLAFIFILGGAFLVGEYYSNSSKLIIQRQLTGENNIEKAWNFYKIEGFSEEATAAILGNFIRESKMNPEIEEKGNKIGYGIAQWSFTRRSDLEKWTKENDFKFSSLEGQLNFSVYEMEKMKFGKYSYEQFKKMKNIPEATKIFEEYYERAGVVALDERIKFANEVYGEYKTG